MRLLTLQALIIGGVLLGGLGVAAIGTPVKLRGMCSHLDKTDQLGVQLCSDIAAGRR